MNTSRVNTLLLGFIAAALLVLALHPLVEASPVQAQTAGANDYFVEPGVQTLILPEGGQILGKVVLDLNTGNIWGFATNGSQSYPVSPFLGGKSPVSHAIPLGRFAVQEMRK